MHYIMRKARAIQPSLMLKCFKSASNNDEGIGVCADAFGGLTLEASFMVEGIVNFD